MTCAKLRKLKISKIDTLAITRLNNLKMQESAEIELLLKAFLIFELS